MGGVNGPAGMKTSRGRSWILRWEKLPIRSQILISAPPLVLFLFLLNAVAMSQPLARSALYGLVEGLPLTGLLVAASRHERSKREEEDRLAR
jgi:hypothetical protein